MKRRIGFCSSPLDVARARDCYLELRSRDCWCEKILETHDHYEQYDD